MTLRFQKYPRGLSEMLCKRSGLYLGLLASKDWSEPPLYNLESLSKCPVQAPGQGGGRGAASCHIAAPLQVLSAWGGIGTEPPFPLTPTPGRQCRRGRPPKNRVGKEVNKPGRSVKASI